jgi:stearoyl-CoA desaturase (delta-9 desaturase)
MHLLPFGAIFTGVHWSAWLVCAGLYLARVFFLTAGYHRYFAHRSYRMGRVMQFLMALGGTTAVQKGPLWWAAHHRHHHKHSDEALDVHSPKRGFWWSHVLWILCPKFENTMEDLIPDFAKYPELRLLNRFHYIPPIIVAVGVLTLGMFVTGTQSGAWGMLLIGFFLSTVLVWHSTFTVNSLAHVFGRRRYATRDTSRNNVWIALATGGEGWHNNHHHYPGSVRQGFFWYEIDWSWYVLLALSKLRLVGALRYAPAHVKAKHLIKQGATDLGMFHKHWERAVKALSDAQTRAGGVATEHKQALEDLVAATKLKVEELAKLGAPSVSSGQ